MTITKCDICKKEIKGNQTDFSISVYDPSRLARYNICLKCGKPILAFLKKHKLSEEKAQRRA